MIQKFKEAGYKIVEFEEIADIYIINTCTVTNISDKKSRQILRRAKHLNKDALVVAVGCYVQVAKENLEKIEEIDLALGTSEKNEIVSNIEKYIANNTEKSRVSDVMHQNNFLDFGAVTYTEKTRAVIKVQDGCDRFCSYCIIPYARGRVRSRKIESIIQEIEQIVQKGIKEVVITGIHIASYGKDFKDGTSLINLLEEINKIEGLKRIRLGSIEPTLITDEFIKRLTKLDKICNHFHLSLQSGCDETLKRMSRRYTTQEFEGCVNILRKAYTDVALTTDVIVGFPGETEKEFNTTYEFLNKIKFYQMHVFKYSPRMGTKAAVMGNQVPGEEKEKRSKMLLELSSKNEEEYKEKFIGKTVEVLFEEKENNKLVGHTSNYLKVGVDFKENLENEIKQVLIKDLDEEMLLGEIN
ncbi:MAG: tRNA (N(6)-L-threonylcarbamoyladenosine(37)-C(2))-methylthiotransferase MtaB [Clostridia bacterium]|nr:tRNA (N(6)-L-threonylcarbamoyladenosine(37)-C(2))-methylthiotransferase MtaB [Clostridia bacterium]